jgi:hypothetical protein
MTDDMARYPSTRHGQEPSGWAVGWIIWALVAHGREFSDARS